MHAHFTLNIDDLLAFQKDVIRHAHTHEIKRKYFKWITSIFIFLILLFLVQLTLPIFILILVITIVYLFIFPFLYNYLMFMKLKGQLQRNNYSHALGACEVTISDEGIKRDINDNVTHFDWSGFEKVNEDNHHYFLYVSDLQGLIIAKAPNNMDADETATYNRQISNYIHDYINKSTKN